jgi:hypothetical protein
LNLCSFYLEVSCPSLAISLDAFASEQYKFLESGHLVPIHLQLS